MKNKFDKFTSNSPEPIEKWWHKEKQRTHKEMYQVFLDLSDGDVEWICWSSSKDSDVKRKALSRYLSVLHFFFLEIYNLSYYLNIPDDEIHHESDRRLMEAIRELGKGKTAEDQS